MLVVTVQPHRTELSTSPDGQWRAELITYPCSILSTEIPESNAYDLLQLVHTSDGLVVTIQDQLQNCGGLGAFGLGEVIWSPNSRYYYFTDAREGVPDGVSLGWMRTLYRYEVISKETEILGPAVLSPDRTEYAASEIWRSGEYWYAPLALVIGTINGEVLMHYDSDFQEDTSWGFHQIAWSPVTNDLVYLETGCLNSGECVSRLYYVDRIQNKRTMLLESNHPSFESVTWEGKGRLVLTDSSFKLWNYDLTTQKLEPKPDSG